MEDGKEKALLPLFVVQILRENHQPLQAEFFLALHQPYDIATPVCRSLSMLR